MDFVDCINYCDDWALYLFQLISDRVKKYYLDDIKIVN